MTGRWLARLRDAGAVPAVEPAVLELVLASSDFVAGALLADPALVAAPDVVEPAPFAAALGAGDEASFMAEMRRARRRALARIAWRDLAGLAATPETLAALSVLADEAIGAATTFAARLLAARYGTPRNAAGDAQPLVVVGMGKLGGGELNFSSDVDLVFLYPEGGDTDGARSIDNFEYFTRLGQTLIRLLDATTMDGFVYRVDMRLRPFGDSGPLVASFAALEDYLQQHGRDWERYAWVKARAITGRDAYEGLFRDVVRPFVFRRYLDYGVFESLREMKAMIAREVEKRELRDHIKLGRGGIREIEFVVQAMQLVRGGSDPRLRSPSLLTVLPRLAGQKLLPELAVRELGAAYEFLRRLENRMQMVADEQTHSLPPDAERRARLATALGARDWEALVGELDVHRAVVARHFAALVLAAESAAPATAGELRRRARCRDHAGGAPPEPRRPRPRRSGAGRGAAARAACRRLLPSARRDGAAPVARAPAAAPVGGRAARRPRSDGEAGARRDRGDRQPHGLSRAPQREPAGACAAGRHLCARQLPAGPGRRLPAAARRAGRPATVRRTAGSRAVRGRDRPAFRRQRRRRRARRSRRSGSSSGRPCSASRCST